MCILFIDLFIVDLGLVIIDVEIDCMFISWDFMLVVLFVFGVVKGDSVFGNIVLFGGLFVVENVCYINGFEVMNMC